MKKLMTGKALTTIVDAGMLFYSAAGLSQDVDNRFNVTLGVIDFDFHSDQGQQDDQGWQLGFEMPLTERFAFDVEYSQIESQTTYNTQEFDVDFLHYGLNYNFNQLKGFQPYIGAGLGNLEIRNAFFASEHTIDLNAGVEYFFGSNWLGKFEAMFISPSGSYDRDYALSLSIGYAFGSRDRRPAAAPAPAPAPQVVSAPVDSDGDGVIDENDRCPNTSRNLAVDADGCPILDAEQRNQTLAVNFDFDRAVVKDEFQQEIADFAEFMEEYSNTRATIEGHTDSVGTEAYNQDLSERRANAVRNVLINRYGIAASRLTAGGFGESRPVADNTTSAGRALNRRIQAAVSVEVQTERRR